MDPKDNREINGTVEGVIQKAGSVQIQEVGDDDLKKINKLAIEPLKAEEVFTFKIIMGDNELDDRNFEPFNLNALKDLKKLYIGKTMIKDHYRRADNQVARIYDTELVTSDKTTGAGEVFTQLIAKCYMVRTKSNEDLITEIKAGIKKEVSTGCTPKRAICSICGTDNMKTYCTHWNGREYEKPDGSKGICYFTLDGAKEAYEVSFVAVPAQPRAGTTKHYGGASMKDAEPTPAEPETTEKEKQESDLLALRVKELDSFIFTNKQEEN